MMASNLLSRFYNNTERSIYDVLRAHDAASEPDIEERAGLELDEENLGFHDDELGNADAFGEESRITTASPAFSPQRHRSRGSKAATKGQSAPSKWVSQSPRLLEEDPDDDVPASLLIEGNDTPGRIRQTKPSRRQAPIPGPSTRETRAHWETAQAQQRLHRDESVVPGAPPPIHRKAAPLSGSGQARERAMWMWINVTNLDNFMAEVYEYYTGSGLWAIVLEDALNLTQIIFVAIFVGFLTQCVDYSLIPGSKKLSEVLVPQCTKKISGMPNVFIWLFTLMILWRIFKLLKNIPRLMRIRDFYLYLLNVPESDMQTISWQDVVAAIMALRDSNPITTNAMSSETRKYLGSQSKQRLDAHDIANRLMRRENYLIAMFNKEILDLTLPIPFLHGRQFFSKALLWNLDWCIMDLVFNELGQVRQLVLKDSHRKQLSDGLRDRFLFAGFMNVLFAPIIVLYLMLVYFFKYFNEFKTNPSAIGSRQYTPLAEWKFRQFNEVNHMFHKRLNMSYPFASRYLDQFPKVKTAHIAKFVAFAAGAIVAVLAVASLLDPELFLNFEITNDRTVLFYVGIFGTLWAIANGAVPEENLVFEPTYALLQVIEYTKFEPDHWKDRLHSDEIKREFSTLYQMKIVIFLEEVLTIIVTPFILWFSLPKCSDQIIDFFREFTIHVDGVGYVCSFAVFDFKNGLGKKPAKHGGNADPREDYYSTKHGKMAASYFGFLDNYMLNPKTAVQGHIPPGIRQAHHPPPSFPGLMSPPFAGELQSSRMGRSERRPRSRPGLPQAARTPRYPAAGANGTPVQSILLDPHHQPSSSGFGARSVNRASRSRYQVRQNIIEEPAEDEDGPNSRGNVANTESRYPEESTIGGLGESRWETSGARNSGKEAEDDEGDGATGAGGVLGLLYQFQKAQTDARPGVNI